VADVFRPSPTGSCFANSKNYQKCLKCPECHAEASDHDLARTMEMTFLCKKCKKAFRKDMEVFEESDEYCPHCDNHFVRAYRFDYYVRPKPDSVYNRLWTPRFLKL
jgi:transposase-like protein